jgi:hypothetical protein
MPNRPGAAACARHGTNARTRPSVSPELLWEAYQPSGLRWPITRKRSLWEPPPPRRAQRAESCPSRYGRSAWCWRSSLWRWGCRRFSALEDGLAGLLPGDTLLGSSLWSASVRSGAPSCCSFPRGRGLERQFSRSSCSARWRPISATASTCGWWSPRLAHTSNARRLGAP